MSKIRRETDAGDAMLEEFLKVLSETKASPVKELLDTINERRNSSVADVVLKYREAVGLDLIKDADVIKNAETKTLAEKIHGIIISAEDKLSPIAPMKLKKIKSPEDMLKNYKEDDLVLQIKFDGFKTQGIKSGEKANVFTRRGESFGENVPELVEDLQKIMPNNSFVLGELVWEDKNGKQSISDIQTVVGSSPKKAHEKLKSGDGKAIFYCYDLLWNNGKNITKNAYIDRYNELKKIIGKGTSGLQIAKNYTYGEKDKALKDAHASNSEGLVIKPKTSEYKYGAKGTNEPVGEWAKFKYGAKAQTDEVILDKYDTGKEKLVFPMYQYKDGELFEVGNLSGMSKEEEADLKKDVDAGKRIVVEITFQERMPSGKFRHVGWSRRRPDKPAKEVKMSSLRPLSIRHAAELKCEDKPSVVLIIEKDPKIKADLHSLCQHSGGHKGIHSIIQFLRETLGNDLVSFSDNDLNEYIEKIKSQYKQELNETQGDPGMVGLDGDDTDQVADYITHGKGR